MNKIFKYTIEDYNDTHGIVCIPKSIRIIRIDHVDDGFYKGNFLWGIVDPEDKNLHDVKIAYKDIGYNIDKTILTSYDRVQLSVKEKQEVFLYSKPEYAQDVNGKLFLYYKPFSVDKIGKSYTIAFYKTGQEIDLSVEKLKYIGLCRLWIMQELGLYTFLYEN